MNKLSLQILEQMGRKQLNNSLTIICKSNITQVKNHCDVKFLSSAYVNR